MGIRKLMVTKPIYDLYGNGQFLETASSKKEALEVADEYMSKGFSRVSVAKRVAEFIQ